MRASGNVGGHGEAGRDSLWISPAIRSAGKTAGSDGGDAAGAVLVAEGADYFAARCAGGRSGGIFGEVYHGEGVENCGDQCRICRWNDASENESRMRAGEGAASSVGGNDFDGFDDAGCDGCSGSGVGDVVTIYGKDG